MVPVSFDDSFLFHERPLDNYLAGRRKAALEEVNGLGSAEILSNQVDLKPRTAAELTARIVDHQRLDSLTLDFDAAEATPVTESDGVLGTSIIVPFTGPPELLTLHANHVHVRGEARGTVVADEDGKRVVFWIRSADLAREFERLLAERRGIIESKADFTNQLVEQFNQDLLSVISAAVSDRIRLLAQVASTQASLPISIRCSPEGAVPLPMTRREIAPRPRPLADAGNADPGGGPDAGGSQHSQGSERTFAPEWVLEDAVYQEVLRTLTLFAAAAGRLPRSAGKLDEGDYRNFALMVLNSNFEMSAARGEVFNGLGKTDLLVPWRGHNAFVGEVKRYDGAQTVADALTQLLGYVTWDDTKAALIIIIDRVNPSQAVDQTYAAVESHLSRRESLSAANSDRRRDFVVAHPHDSRRTVRLAVIPIVIASADRTPQEGTTG